MHRSMSRIAASSLVIALGVSFGTSKQPSTKRTIEVFVFWGNVVKDPEMLDCAKGYPVVRRIPPVNSLRDSIVFTLNELLKGPTSKEESLGYRIPVPSPEQIRQHKERVREYVLQNPRAPRSGQFWISDKDTIVTLKRVKLIRDSVFVMFSKSMIAYGGGSCRVAGILGPMRQTVLQFPSVRRIGFWIEGTPRGEWPFQP